MEKIYILGAGSYGEALLELAEDCGYEVVGFYDDDESKIGNKILSSVVLGTIKELIAEDLSDKNFAVAIGNNCIRRGLLEKIRCLGGNTPSLVHPTVHVSKYATIGIGTYIQPRAIIWTKVKIENDCIISPNVVIAHHSVIGAGSLISTMTAIGSNIVIEKDVFVGMGSTIMTGVKNIGFNSLIGAGAVVTKDVEPSVVVAGIPAKIIKHKELGK